MITQQKQQHEKAKSKKQRKEQRVRHVTSGVELATTIVQTD
jgi:hypothetical protein